MIFLTGDTHCPFDIKKLDEDFPEQEVMNKNDYLIILGDAGIIWSDKNGRDAKWIKYFDEKPYTTLFVDGNHENHAKLSSFDVSLWNGGKVHKISDSVYHLMRGQFFEIWGVKFFTMGGAKSMFSEYCTEGRGWWSAELPSREEYDEARENLAKNGWKTDYVLSHSVSDTVAHMIGPEFGHNAIYDFFEEIDPKMTYRQWYFGHFHLDEQIDEKHTCIFNKFIRII